MHRRRRRRIIEETRERVPGLNIEGGRRSVADIRMELVKGSTASRKISCGKNVSDIFGVSDSYRNQHEEGKSGYKVFGCKEGKQEIRKVQISFSTKPFRRPFCQFLGC